MTESLFFSQIASKSLAAKSKSAVNPKSYQGDSSAFDKHLSLSDRANDRDRDRDNVTELRKEPRFTQDTRSRDYGNDERAEPKIKDSQKDDSRQERADAKENTKEAAREQDTGKTQEKGPAENETRDAAEGEKTAKETSASAENTAPQEGESDTVSVDDGVLALLTQVEEEFAPETAETATRETAEIAPAETQTPQTDTAIKTETAEIVPLFKEEAAISDETTQTAAEVLSAAQNVQGQPEQTEEAATLQAIKQPKQTGLNNAEAQIAAKVTQDATKPGLNRALANVSGDLNPANANAEVVEVQNASKNASFLGDVNVEQAQKADKSEIKARIGDLTQKTTPGPVATSMQVKTTQITPQLAGAKPEGLSQIQPLTTDTALTSTQNMHNVQVRFGSLPQATQSAQIPVTTMAFHIAKSVENGVNRFEIRIDPPELGRVEVKLEVNQAGRVIANLTVERPETLDLLQRDQRALERALQDAGLDVGGESLNFSLKDQNARSSEDSASPADQIASTADEEEDTIEPEMITGYITNSGVDIRI